MWCHASVRRVQAADLFCCAAGGTAAAMTLLLALQHMMGSSTSPELSGELRTAIPSTLIPVQSGSLLVSTGPSPCGSGVGLMHRSVALAAAQPGFCSRDSTIRAPSAHQYGGCGWCTSAAPVSQASTAGAPSLRQLCGLLLPTAICHPVCCSSCHPTLRASGASVPRLSAGCVRCVWGA